MLRGAGGAKVVRLFAAGPVAAFVASDAVDESKGFEPAYDSLHRLRTGSNFTPDYGAEVFVLNEFGGSGLSSTGLLFPAIFYSLSEKVKVGLVEGILDESVFLKLAFCIVQVHW